MLLKWKIYYVCSLYYLVWNIGLIVSILYMVISDKDSGGIYMLLIVPPVVITKSALSIKFINHLKNKTAFNDGELLFFVTCFLLNIIFTLIVAAVFYSVTSNIDWIAEFNSPNILLIASTALFILSSCYLMMLDLRLRSIVRRQHHDDIITIGQDIKENK